MSDIREKLAEFIEEENGKVYKDWRKQYSGKKLPENISSASQWADAILAKFDVVEKKKPWFVVGTHVNELTDRDSVYEGRSAIALATFFGEGSYERAREYAAFLNSKEAK